MMRWLALLLLLLPAPAFAQATVVTSCGTASYTAGTPHNVTIDTNGQSCQQPSSAREAPETPNSAPPAPKEPKR